MSETGSYTQTMSITNGPTLTNTTTFTVDAYDRTSVIIPPFSSKNVGLHASDNTHTVAIYIMSSLYVGITYALLGMSGRRSLTGPLMLVTNDLLGVATNWQEIEFFNVSTTVPAYIDVLVLRESITA